MDRTFVILGSLVMLVAVALGAFGAHALRDHFAAKADLKNSYETAVRYQMIHGLAILFVALLIDRWGTQMISAAGWLFLGGVVLFSGSLYLLAITDQRWLGAITPLGGIVLLVGWLLLLIAAWRH